MPQAMNGESMSSILKRKIMSDPDLRGYLFRPNSHQDTQSLVQLLQLALQNKAGLSRPPDAAVVGGGQYLGASASQEIASRRREPPRANGSKSPTAPVDPNFRQLTRVSSSQNRYGLGNDGMTSNAPEDPLRSSEGRPLDKHSEEPSAASARLGPVEAGLGRVVRPFPFPPFGPTGSKPKPHLPEWWPTLEELLRIYPMVRYGRVHSGNNNEDCMERHHKEVSRCYERYRQGEYAHKDFLSACKERASNRRNLCVGNGGKPRPDEPKEWGLQDEEVYRNLDR